VRGIAAIGGIGSNRTESSIVDLTRAFGVLARHPNGALMKLPNSICGHPGLKVRDLFKAFIDLEPSREWHDGKLTSEPKRLTSEFIATGLQISIDSAKQVALCLVVDGWLEPSRPVPTHKGMSLAQYVARPRIARAKAEALVDKVVAWAKDVNARPGSKVKAQKLEVYGSYLTDVANLGDLDLIVIFNREELGDDFQPEDNNMIDRLLVQLSRISKYISPSNEIDRNALIEATFKTIFKA
jgi:hypothetical protein